MEKLQNFSTLSAILRHLERSYGKNFGDVFFSVSSPFERTNFDDIKMKIKHSKSKNVGFMGTMKMLKNHVFMEKNGKVAKLLDIKRDFKAFRAVVWKKFWGCFFSP